VTGSTATSAYLEADERS
ncbi:MAG: hypothetical protein QG597_4540, partial [Actinomycetota bacterium]|nr:hypothetical protein [Actinomycetota bacterium]